MTDTYRTISSISEGIYKDKGSKFISFALPVQRLEEIKEILKEYRKEYYDARHVCYAYMLGAERKDFRANDDGEPSGTAGKPILGQINSRELTDILIIVIRYFGGTLLGTSGLIKAYKEAAADALDYTEIIEKTVDCNYIISFEYPLMNQVMRVIKDHNAEITGQNYEQDCVIQIKIRKQDADLVYGKLQKIDGVTIKDFII